MASLDRIKGSIFGLAYGDALAAEAEFLDVPEILDRWPGGPRELEGDPALVTDDTQMATAVGEALVEVLTGAPSVADVQNALAASYTEWFLSSDNTRSPGLTCLGASARLSQGLPWTRCTVIHSKGCGSNMRVAPVGLFVLSDGASTSDGAPLSVSTLAQMQAAMTHGHPTALVASELTARSVAWLADGASPTELVSLLRDRVRARPVEYHQEWLGDLWRQQHGAASGEDFIARGWDECAVALSRLDAALDDEDRETDPCDQTGSAWVAEEALATGLLCFLLYPDRPVDALNRASVTRGDSDSIAAITGALVGAHLGFSAWPESWYQRIEGSERLARLVSRIDRCTA